MEDKLSGRKALVTGAGTGIGREIALEFARQGADVVLHYAHSDSGARSAAEEIAGMGRRTAVVQADFDAVDDVLRLADEATEFLGRVDCLVNNAGISFNKPFLKITPEQFDMMFHVNIRAQFFLTQRIAEQMIGNGGGAVCSITSIHGISGAPEHSLYAATKGAIVSYTRSLAVELAHKGVRINAIAPGCVLVENYHKVNQGYTEEDTYEWAKDAIPVGFPGVPVDIARLATFLCSDDARYIIGQTIVADGGTTSLMSLATDFRNESTSKFGIGYLPGV